jgi:hypothetical protein
MLVERSFYTSFERIVAAGAIHGNHNGKTKDYKLQATDMAIKIIRNCFFHPLLGNEDVELTAKLFAFNRFTFQNWISQPRYFCKWVELVNGLCVKDVLAMIPAIHGEHFTNVNGTSKVQLRQCYTAVDQKGIFHITACGLIGSNHTRQKKPKISKKSNGKVVYIAHSSKTIGGGRKPKYNEEETYIIDAITIAWETGNPLSKVGVYAKLIAQFGGTGSQWVFAMQADSGFIASPLSQWLARVLRRHEFTIRKE